MGENVFTVNPTCYQTRLSCPLKLYGMLHPNFLWLWLLLLRSFLLFATWWMLWCKLQVFIALVSTCFKSVMRSALHIAKRLNWNSCLLFMFTSQSLTREENAKREHTSFYIFYCNLLNKQIWKNAYLVILIWPHEKNVFKKVANFIAISYLPHRLVPEEQKLGFSSDSLVGCLESVLQTMY